MKSTRTAALFAALLSAAASVVLAVPAHADDQVDPMFLQVLHEKGIKLTDSNAITLAHGTCSAMRGGGVNSALTYLKKNTTLSNDDTVKFGGLAIYAYCRELAPKQ